MQLIPRVQNDLGPISRLQEKSIREWNQSRRSDVGLFRKPIKLNLI